ncbi:MAG: hypothetical protein KZQ64_15290 [gamma proteobacterium symbiont of Bathyaustriella thionipta]|nr:hypothetical protein [gamma proteobacterium symbiont of Bathyaustriella thionipta]MCU7950599.1 hypothetical protein [gamma proteobacterium symbiont of Bathyaustriella thionipta]MCU7954733.1 hypothetical protein [gamma proteobacterium symbiont of Bathyaustriella thionipta]MCU7957107.1 hypothetical protein [gamma proteobacterium symbiont of Bathyaustriella thionipta]MCU7968991.1 hypothetical protein [gamma proteobacterium symbiont of Bathyaustriella thionipta]
MKWVFVSVLLINAGYFVYSTFFNIELNTQKHKNTSQVKNQLVLLNELTASELNALKDKASFIDKKEQTLTSISKTVTKEQNNNQVTDTDKEEIIPVSQKTSTLINLCYSLGPITKSMMDDIRLQLEEKYNKQLSFGIETTSPITYYRIYIPPLESKQKIKDTLAILDENDLKDHYVMSIDGRKNAIALGVFKQKKAAQKIAGIAEGVGLSTTIEAISNDKNSLYRLHITFQKEHDITKFNELIKLKNLESSVCENKG